MTRREPPRVTQVVRAVEAQGRPMTRGELAAICAPRTLDRAVAAGALLRVAPARYAPRAVADTPATRIAAAAGWMPASAHIAGAAALYLWGIEGLLGDTVDIATGPHVSGPAPQGMRLWRSRAVVDVWTIDGVRTASREDAFIQWWCRRPKPLTEGPALDALRDGAINAGRAIAQLNTYPRVPARALLRKILESFEGGAHSALEYRARHDVFAGPEWRDWVRQAVIQADGRTARADMAHARARLAVEFDGSRYHNDDTKRRRDLERDAVLAGAGYTTMRFTWEDIVNRPEWCRERVRAALRARGF